MTALILLYTLALIDGLFVGYRDALGRNPLLNKTAYYRAAMWHGLRIVLFPLTAITLVAGASYNYDPDSFMASYYAFTTTLLWVLGAYATCVLLAFAAYRISDYDVQSFVTISAFGTLTLARPFVIIGAATLAALVTNEPLVWPTALTIATTMGLLQPVVARLGHNAFDWQKLRD